MFPAGAAGYGLLILRLCAAGMLIHPEISDGTVILPLWQLVGAAIVALLLCLGLFTPLCCVASSIIQIAMKLDQANSDSLQLAFSLAVTAALLLLGPGAFSIDSRLFGRRLIVRSK
jgi:hypothetical protein